MIFIRDKKLTFSWRNSLAFNILKGSALKLKNRASNFPRGVPRLITPVMFCTYVRGGRGYACYTSPFLVLLHFISNCSFTVSRKTLLFACYQTQKLKGLITLRVNLKRQFEVFIKAVFFAEPFSLR